MAGGEWGFGRRNANDTAREKEAGKGWKKRQSERLERIFWSSSIISREVRL